jgi:histone H2A
MSTVNLQTYIRKLAKQIHPDHRVSADFTTAVNNMLNVLGQKLLLTAIAIKKNAGRVELQAKDIKAATEVVLPPDLYEYATRNATKAVTIASSGKIEGRRVTRTEEAKLTLSVPRVETFMRDNIPKRTGRTRISKYAIVYLTAVLEYITAETCELSGNEATANKKVTMTKTHYNTALLSDKSLKQIIDCHVR